MSETLKERLDNLEMWLSELAKDKPWNSVQNQDQANYHLATIDLIRRQQNDNEN